MDGRGGQDSGVLTGIGCLDANKVTVSLIGKILEGCGFFEPWIPDDGGEGVCFGNGNGALPVGVVEREGSLGSEVDSVGFFTDLQGILFLDICFFWLGGCV